jgi:hypothetical protein
MFARLDQPYKRLKTLAIPFIHSLRTNIETKSYHETGSSPRAAYWLQSKKCDEYIVTLQKGHGAFLGDRKEKRVRLAKNKITSLADSKGSSPKRSPNALGMEQVGKRVRRWEDDPRLRESRRFLDRARERSANIMFVREASSKLSVRKSKPAERDGTTHPRSWVHPVLRGSRSRRSRIIALRLARVRLPSIRCWRYFNLALNVMASRESQPKRKHAILIGKDLGKFSAS